MDGDTDKEVVTTQPGVEPTPAAPGQEPAAKPSEGAGEPQTLAKEEKPAAGQPGVAVAADDVAKPVETQVTPMPPANIPPVELKTSAETPSQIAAMQAKMDAREKQLVGEYAKAEYILEKCGDLPRDIVRQMLPATEDKAALAKAEQSVRGSLQGWIAQLMAQGKIKRASSACEYMQGGHAPQPMVNSRMTAGQLFGQRQR